MTSSSNVGRRRRDAQILDLLSQVGPLNRILASLCRSAEETHKDISVCLLQIDAAAQMPSISAAPAFLEEIGQIVNQLGSRQNERCRASMGQTRINAVSQPIDRLSAIHRRLALHYGFSDYWCAPISSPTDSRFLGMLGFYCQSARPPNPSEKMSMEAIVHLASLFIDRQSGCDAWRGRVISSSANMRRPLRENLGVRRFSQETHGRA